ncbi:hypothetical protein ACFV3E_12125 [Streptomyces sp. NPDC059718]
MSRFAQVIVIAKDAHEVMEPLTRPDEGREWHQCFESIGGSWFDAWAVEIMRLNWHGLLAYLESLPWPDPYSVQVLIQDEEDDCFGLWTLCEGRLVEVSLPNTDRYLVPGHTVTGVFTRTDRPRHS